MSSGNKTDESQRKSTGTDASSSSSACNSNTTNNADGIANNSQKISTNELNIFTIHEEEAECSTVEPSSSSRKTNKKKRSPLELDNGTSPGAFAVPNHDINSLQSMEAPQLTSKGKGSGRRPNTNKGFSARRVIRHWREQQPAAEVSNADTTGNTSTDPCIYQPAAGTEVRPIHDVPSKLRMNSTPLVNNNNDDDNDDDDHQSVFTTSTMATVAVINRNNQQQQRISSATPSTRSSWIQPSRSSSKDGSIGDFFSEEEVAASISTSGRWCERCGNEQTHKKEKFGLFGVLFTMVPQTVEGRIYKGYCLCYHDVYDLRRLLNDPNIPLSLVRHDSNTSASVRLLQGRGSILHDATAMHKQKNKNGSTSILCSSIQFQIVCGIILVAIVGACIAAIVIMTEAPEPWVAPSAAPSTLYPTAAPTSYAHTIVATIAKDGIESFGYNVELSRDGNILAVASPGHADSRGRLDIFQIDPPGWKAIGEPIIGDLIYDQLGLGMELSGDGKTVAVGLPGNGAGLVQVYSIDLNNNNGTGSLSPKGLPITGPSPLSQFGFSVSVNFDGSRLFVGAPQFGDNVDETYGFVQAYEFDGIGWVTIGGELIGERAGSRFGHSVSTDGAGDKVVIGAPLDSIYAQEEGSVFILDFVDLDWVTLAKAPAPDVIRVDLEGSFAGSQLGRQVSMDCTGTYFMSGDRNYLRETFVGAGLIRFWKLDPDLGLEGLRDVISGTYDEANLGNDLDFDCTDADEATSIFWMPMVASSRNRNSQAGSVVLSVWDNTGIIATSEFLGPELGDTAWFSKGPSVALASDRNRFAVGYENVRSDDGSSRSEIHIYDNVAL